MDVCIESLNDLFIYISRPYKENMDSTPPKQFKK